jgi:hypothetical protein
VFAVALRVANDDTSDKLKLHGQLVWNAQLEWNLTGFKKNRRTFGADD